MIRYIFLVLILLTGYENLYGQYEITENCKNAWVLLMDMKIDEAKNVLEQELAVNPENYYALYLEQTCDAYALFINSDKNEFEDFLDNYDSRREIMDDKYEDSPYYLMCKSEMDVQVCYFKVIHGYLFSGIRKGYSGYREVYKNLEQHPGFIPSLKLDGFFNAALSNLPPFIKSAISIFGVSSDFNYGIKTLRKVYEDRKSIKGLNAESALFLFFASKINKTPEDVYNFSQSLDKSVSDLFLPKYFTANIEYRTGRNEQALKSLSELHYSNSSYAVLIYNYMMGKALLRKLDDNAGHYIEQYLLQLRKEEYFKEMTYNLALSYLIKGDRKKYKELCKVVIEKGSDINERDREALYDASLDYEPDINLTKARLLLDGGYLDRFEKVMADYENEFHSELPYQLEYNFLKGRYFNVIGDKIKAKAEFREVLEMGQSEDYYFSCAAALYLGDIYKEWGDIENAKKYYKISSKLYKDEYYEYLGNLIEKALRKLK